MGIKKILKENSIIDIVKKIFKRLHLKVDYYIYKLYFTNKYNLSKKHDFKNYHTEMSFFYNVNNKIEIKAFYDKEPMLREKVIKQADKIINHEFDILGSQIQYFKDEIKWSEDFKSGFNWSNEFYRDIQIIDLKNNADVKVPWELSRFQHLFMIGKAYWLTNDLKYFNEFKFEIMDWIEKNPFGKSVNWTNAMEVGIRSINWIFSYFLFEDKLKKDKEFMEIFNESLFLHGKFIRDNLENYSKLRNNHYLSNLVALIYLGLYFKKLKNRTKYIEKKWLVFSIRELERELSIQINDDGTTYETSTGYHRLVSELSLFTALIYEKNDLHVSNEFKIKLEKMHTFLADITKKNNLTPLIGDYDNGRLIILSDYFSWNKRQLNNTLGIAGIFLDNNYLKKYGQQFSEESLWINGEIVTTKNNEKRIKKLKAYPDGGIYVLENESIYCMIRCGELSLKGQGGHSHNDQLSIELSILGKDFIVDPGSYVYTASVKERNYNRSTYNHNTLWIRGLEQNKFDNDIFTMKEETFSRVINFNNFKFEGEHFGYINKISGIHNRKIEIDKNLLSISDTLLKSKFSNKLEIYQIYVLNPEVIIEKVERGLVLKNGEVRIFVNMHDYIIEETYISIGYGDRTATKKILRNLNDEKVTFQII